MDIKPRPNHKRYIEVLRAMTPEQKWNKIFELSKFARELMKQGVRSQFPDLSEEEIHAIYLKRLEKCHNRNW